MTDELVVVSADGHAGAQIEDYRPYLPRRYWPDLEELKAEDQLYSKLVTRPLQPTDEALDVFDRRGAVRAGGVYGAWDLDVRLRELDADGIAGEIIHYSTQLSTAPFFSHVNRVRPPELQMVGAQAHNRWLADFMAPADGRLRGVAEPGPCRDIAATIDELAWAADHGFVSVTMPGGIFDPSLPPLHDPHFDPFFAACEELGLVVSIHAGWGAVQGAFLDAIAAIKNRPKGRSPFAPPDEGPDPLTTMSPGALSPHPSADTPAMKQDSPLRLTWGTRRPIWQLMAGGVLDRHPDLTLAMTEVRADWVPDTIAQLDRQLSGAGVTTALKPSEYYRRNIVVTPSSIHRAEVEMRHRIGDHQLLFGADYPHWEGTWPNTRDWIRTAFAGVPEAEVREILAGNAIAAYRLDESAIRATAARVGPSVDLLGAGAADDELVRHFHQRSGYSRGADPVDVDELAQVVAEDLAAIGGG
ncbi:MAG TPA: amidohydrolase family protein [Acidimicrobiales bacterium]